MSKKLTVCLELNVYDEIVFRRAAATEAFRDGESQEEADKYLDPEAHGLTDCAMMVCGPASNAGCEIIATTATDDPTFAEKLAELLPNEVL